MDETAIKYHYTKVRGYKAKQPNADMQQYMADRSSHRNAKSHCTLVGTLASDPMAQEKMPQLFTPNTIGRKKAWATTKKHNTRSTVQINLDSNGWMNIETMHLYLDMLAKVVKDLGKEKVVLVMDCHTAHYSIEVLKKVRSLKWKVLLIPSKLTWLLQPLDVGLFSGLKHKLYLQHVQNQIKSTTGEVKFPQWSKTVMDVVQEQFQTADGRSMFEKCGFGIPTHAFPKKIQPFLPTEDLGFVRKVSMDELTSYMGIRADAHYRLLFQESIPHDRVHQKIVLCTPTHRMTSKRSLSSMML